MVDFENKHSQMSFVIPQPATMQSMYEGNRLPTSPKREQHSIILYYKM